MGAINLFQHLFGPEYFPKNLKVVEDLKALAAKYEKTLPQFALRWTLSNPVVSTALVGCRNVNEVKAIVEVLQREQEALDSQSQSKHLALADRDAGLLQRVRDHTCPRHAR